MRMLLTAVGAAALLTAGPALADPGKVKGNKVDKVLAQGNKYGGAACPPGLAKKGCIPPGQAKRMFREGQRLPLNYRYYTPYGDLPVVLRDRYDLDDDYRYIYRDNVIYVVDPETRLIRTIIDAIL